MFNMSAFLSYVFVVTFTPGPNNIMAMANAGKFGLRKSFKFNLGVFAGFFIIMTLSAYFNLLLFNFIPKIKPFMQILGAGFMLYLAYKIVHTKAEPTTEEENNTTHKESNASADTSLDKKWGLFFTGITLQFINPKAIIYAITVVSNFIIPYYKSNLAFILFALLLSSISLMSTTSWALFGSLFNRFLSKYQKQFDLIMGLLLVYSAFSISGIMDLF